MTIEAAVAEFGALAKAKLNNPAVSGEPEDQLRAPFEQLWGAEIRTRPDCAVTVQKAPWAKLSSLPSTPDDGPDTREYDPTAQRLRVGKGFIEPIAPAVWHDQASGKPVLVQWFNNRRKHRKKPQIGDRRPPSPLGAIQPGHWWP